jgi:hypothetical protein
MRRGVSGWCTKRLTKKVKENLGLASLGAPIWPYTSDNHAHFMVPGLLLPTRGLGKQEPVLIGSENF